MKKIFITMFMCLPLLLNAQQLISTAGTESGGVVWSVGEVMTTTLKNSDSSVFVTQGLLQPGYFQTTGIVDNEKVLTLKAYPNPVIDNLYIKMESQENTCTWKLYNMTGMLLNTGQTSFQDELVIAFKNYPNGHYIVTITTDKEVCTVKVIK